ncbi:MULTISPECIES: polyisoprenyl-teichoic acid--peptidoglycan teichoic acid transferase TagV [Bacillus]|jgi:LCP family protein required for cell wall assembly|uniref:polyisoprenyl-teichoic acid--peptidoglycan teichoic acid transferase TagV n=1 Tax=Bacillus TaxID=1386 RepID=UPI0002A150A9|nr:polyisoprenyl-teichoic acid--peptidoglycan teichoic acid transferase TagV [Bacillus subtilis]MDP4121722.1 polyisoprenyl-teichoic acid--peptidoglycan teichoic acid transferase TagV [Bacillota bacterium]CJS14874.1 transcriptional attenuator LytR [Streptococcus pneumoniae]AGA21792.1 Transcriptional regulator YvhJ [Bacillus subtilis subsp. subtilis str. BSP1]AGE65152.1 putative membrane bound transcriptional regulator [Bacillus subtilis XF-1]AGI30695.1 putative membrane bound transcriptional re
MAERVRVRVRKKKKSKRRKILKRIMLLFALALLVVVGLGGYKLYKTINAADESYDALSRGNKSNLRNEVVDMKKKPFSILFMGIEDYATKGQKGRSDSLIVVTLDPKNKTMKMLSIPRDTRVQLAGDTTGSKTKINAAYSKGGKDETVETVENFLQIPIDKYVTVDFDGFKDVINEVGGIDVDVPFDFDEKSDVDESKRIYFKKGEMHLNGEEALAYARMRKQDKRGDFGRNDRQKQILNALIDRMSSASNIAKIDKIAEKASENVETNIRITEGLALQQIYSGFTSKKIDTLSITGSDLYLGPNNTYYFEPDATNLEKVRKTLQEHLDYTPDTSTGTSGTGSATDGTDSSSSSGSTGTTTDGTTSGSSYSNDSSTSSNNSTTNSTTDSSY